MRGDFSRFADSDSFKHYVAAFMQQGRVQLDSDWNENVVNFLNILWKQARDFVGTSSCIGDSFRIGKDIPIDHMLQASLWKAVDGSDNYLEPGQHGYIFLNTNDRPRANIHSTNEKACLFVQNTNGILREFGNLDLSRYKSIYLRFKVPGRSFQIARCRRCSRRYKRGQQQQYCTHCGASLREDFPTLTLRLYSRKEENDNDDNRNNNNIEVKDEYVGQFIELPDASNFLKAKFDLSHPSGTATTLDKLDISHISKLAIHWDKIDEDDASSVCIGLISAEPMALVVTADTDGSNTSNSWTDITNAITNNASQQKISISITYKGKPTIEKKKGKEMKWFIPRPLNFNSLNFLRFSIRKGRGTSSSGDDSGSRRDDDWTHSNPTLFLVNSNNRTLEYSLTEVNELSTEIWRSYSVNLKNPKDTGNNFTTADALNQIQIIGLRDLPENDTLFVSEILGELNFETNFLISSDMELDQSARMYVNGILCSGDHWETYLTQKHISSSTAVDYFMFTSSNSDKTGYENYYLSKNEEERYEVLKKKPISYMVYADVWKRGITPLEDPSIREIALGGADTATRLQTICQIKIKEIPDHLNFQEKIRFAEDETEAMNEERTGRLSTIYPSNSSSSSSLTNSESNFGSLGNHLYRIQIHDSGEGRSKSKYHNNKNMDRDSATFKWSKDNASLAFAIKKLTEYQVVLDPGGRRLDSVFRIGGLIEIIDDIDELSEQPRGQMRRITQIDLDRGTLSWSHPTNSVVKTGVNYLHEPVTIKAGRYRHELHPKVILWDGLEYVKIVKKEGEGEHNRQDSSYNAIPLDSSLNAKGGIRLKFGEGIFRSGHYWTFTTRSNGGVELLNSARPTGPKHDYALLSVIRKEIGKEIEIIEDLRHTFQSLSNLRAIDIPYDNGGGDQLHSAPSNVQAAIQRLSEERTHFIPGKNNTLNGRSIKELLIEAGEIYELKPTNLSDGRRTFSARVSFNDVYEHKPFFIYAIRTGNSWDVRHRIHMLASDDQGHAFRNPIDDGTKNYVWKGFEIEADENAQVSWLALGDSPAYHERFLKRVIDEVFRVIFGVDTDLLKVDNSILDAWYKKNLRNLSESGSDLVSQARQHLDAIQNDFDRWVRKVDRHMQEVGQELEEVFDFDEPEQKIEEEKKEEEKQEEQEKEEHGEELPEPSAQIVNCPSCGRSYPKGKYVYCTNCRAKLPTEKEQEKEEHGEELPEPSAQIVNCPSCGRSYPKGKYVYCTNCRAKLPTE